MLLITGFIYLCSHHAFTLLILTHSVFGLNQIIIIGKILTRNVTIPLILKDVICLPIIGRTFWGPVYQSGDLRTLYHREEISTFSNYSRSGDVHFGRSMSGIWWLSGYSRPADKMSLKSLVGRTANNLWQFRSHPYLRWECMQIALRIQECPCTFCKWWLLGSQTGVKCS